MVGNAGFALDRHWMVINAKNKGIYQIPETRWVNAAVIDLVLLPITGQYITACPAFVPRMALIEPRLPEGALLGDWRTLPPEVAVLTLTAPGMPPLKVDTVPNLHHCNVALHMQRREISNMTAADSGG